MVLGEVARYVCESIFGQHPFVVDLRVETKQSKSCSVRGTIASEQLLSTPNTPPAQSWRSPRPPCTTHTFNHTRSVAAGKPPELRCRIPEALCRIGPASGVPNAVDARQQVSRVVLQGAHQSRPGRIGHNPHPIACCIAEFGPPHSVVHVPDHLSPIAATNRA